MQYPVVVTDLGILSEHLHKDIHHVKKALSSVLSDDIKKYVCLIRKTYNGWHRTETMARDPTVRRYPDIGLPTHSQGKMTG